MRGKAPCRAVLPHAIGITPAYAGKRTEITEVEDENGDHPRLCGEKLPQCLYLFHHVGSPPPMRGKVLFTPFAKSRRKDHPRLCGEKTKKITKQRYFFHQPASFSFSLQYT